MFTGIVTAIGTIREARKTGDLRAVITCPFDTAGIATGASIACSGVCLTVVDKGGVAGDAWFAVDISAESVSRTAPGRSVGTGVGLAIVGELATAMGGTAAVEPTVASGATFVVRLPLPT